MESTVRTNLQKINCQQEHAIKIVYSKKRLSHTREIFKERKVLPVYQENIWKMFVSMYQINFNTIPSILLNRFKNSTHNYPTNFTRTNSIPLFNPKSKYSNWYRKKQQKTSIFKLAMLNKLPVLENKLILT